MQVPDVTPSPAKWKTTEIFRQETEFARQNKFAVQRFRFIKRGPIIALTGDLLIFIWTRNSVVDMEKVYSEKKDLYI